MTEATPLVNVHDSSHGAVFEVRVHPRAKRTAVLGAHDGKLKIALSASPVDGRANEDLIRFLAEVFGVSRSMVHLLTGAHSRTKRIAVVGQTSAQISAAIQPLLTQ
jgi:uncharacterized protein (TIGR00251 family)